MTCAMAASHQKKRLTDSYLQPDQHRSRKKPKPHLSHSLVNFNSRIHLKWDGSSNRVVPRKEQIGISWSHLAPFIESPRKRPSGLAHVSCVPRQIFALENLSDVLSSEVWSTFLTEEDRNMLAAFLPTGTIAEEAVHLLLSGHNHHFGNPFLSWSSSLFHGDLHPDAVLDIEQRNRADKETYYADLHNYHSMMIQMLNKWKDKWLTCDNPENLFRYNPAKHRQGGLQSHDENIFSHVPKKEMPMKGVRNGGVSKFMSYIKISRSQHDLVKRMKRSADGVQVKHLTRVIGDIGDFHVKPYETLVEDEKKRLHNCWAILSCKHLPAAFVAREIQKLLIENLRKSLCLDLAQKNISVVEKAEQVTGVAEEVGRDGAFQNYCISDEQEQLVEHSPQDVLQVGNEHNSVLGDEDVEDTNDADMNNILSANSNAQINHLTVDQKEADVLLSRKGHVQGLESTAPVSKCEEDLLQLSNPPENSLHTRSGDLQHKHSYSGGQTTTIEMVRDVRSLQQPQVAITAALSMGNSVSLLQQCTSQQNNQEVRSGAKDIGMVPSYSLGHVNDIKQSMDLNPMMNNCLAQSALVRDLLMGHMQPLDQRHDGLGLHQVQKNLYSGAELCTEETFRMVEWTGVGAHTPADQSYNWFRNEDPSHDSWSAMEFDGIEAQDLPSVSSADGSLFSVLSQYKQASSGVQLGALSSNQSRGTRNLVHPAQNVHHRAQNTALSAPNIYRYTMNLPRDVSSHVASVGTSVSNLQWANLAQQSHGVPDSSFGQFQGPWSR